MRPDRLATLVILGIALLAGGILSCAKSFGQEAPGGPPPSAACGVLKAMEANLAKSFGEVQLWTGTQGDGSEIRLYVSGTEANTWTILLVHGENACVKSTGNKSNFGAENLPGMPA
jgi:hypothetical protein